MVLGAEQVNGVKFQTETLPFDRVDRRCRGDVVGGPQVARRLHQPVKLDQFAPRVGLGEALTEISRAPLSHRKDEMEDTSSGGQAGMIAG